MFTPRIMKVFLFLIYINLQLQKISALQCYYCENCNEHEELQELHICGELPTVWEAIETSSRTPTDIATSNEDAISTTTTTTTDAISTVAEMTSNAYITATETTEKTTEITTETTTETTTAVEEVMTETTTVAEMVTTTITNAVLTENVQSPTENTSISKEEATTEPTANMTTSSSTTAALAAATTTTTASYNKTNNNDDDYDDYNERIDYPKARQMLVLEQPICYMVTSMVNGTVTINRGCINLVNNNQTETCAVIQNGRKGNMLDCQLCSTNGCNKFYTEYPMVPGSANKIQMAILAIIFMFTLIIV